MCVLIVTCCFYIYIVELKTNEIIWNANFMQEGNFINVFLAQHVSGIYAHHQEY